MGLGRSCATSESRRLELCGKSAQGEDVKKEVEVAPGEEPALEPLTPGSDPTRAAREVSESLSSCSREPAAWLQLLCLSPLLQPPTPSNKQQAGQLGGSGMGCEVQPPGCGPAQHMLGGWAGPTCLTW